MSTPRKKPRKVSQIIRQVPEIRAEGDHVVAVFDMGYIPKLQERMTIGLRFESPEQLLMLMTEIMEKVVEVWPNHPLVKEYLE